MPYVDALGAAHPDSACQRLMNVAEQRGTRTVALDQGEQMLRSDLGSPGLDVVEQFGDRGRDVAAQHVDAPEPGNSRCEVLGGAQIGTEHRLALRHDPTR